MLITSKDNPKIKLYRKLASSKKARAEQGMFVIEGMINCVDILKLAEQEKVQITALFYTEEAAEKYRDVLEVGLLESFDENRSFVITHEIAEKMSDVGQTQGAFAIARTLDIPFVKEALDPQGKYLVLDNLQDPGNLGTMIRTSAAVGIDGVILTGNTVELYNPKVVRSAMASMPMVKLFIENDYRRVIGTLSERGITTCAAVVSGGETVTGLDEIGGCAVVIGNEGRGLSQEDAELCEKKLTITMRGHIDSLNAAVAGTILLWEMSGRGK